MKKVVSIILVVLMIGASILMVSAENLYPAGDFLLRYTNNNTEYEVAEYTGNSTTVYIPQKANRKQIISVGESVFVNNSTINSLRFFEGLTTIKRYAFLNCQNLSSVVFPESLTTIGEKAFYNCPKLLSITIGKNVTSIGKGAFERCQSLTIYCYTDSAAHQYAVDENVNYVLLDAKEEYILGDTDGNGVVDISDSTYIQQILSHLKEDDGKNSVRGDVDEDGELTILDATILQQYLVEIPTNTNIGQTKEL